MPYDVRKTNKEWCVYKGESKEPIKCHPNEKAARDHVRALYAADEKDKKSLSVRLAEFKLGARHSKGDNDSIQTIHNEAKNLGAECAMNTEGKSLALKCLEAYSPYGAYVLPNLSQEEANDISEAAYALAQLAALARGEAGERDDDPKDLQQLAAVMTGLLKFIQGEIDMTVMAAEPPPATNIESSPPPEVIASQKVLSLAYVKNLNLSHDEQYLRDVVAVKSKKDGEIEGYLTLWGNPTLPDLTVDYFTGKTQKNAPNPPTDFWDDRVTLPIPLTWNHGMDRALVKSTEVIGSVVEAWDDEIGRAYRAILDRSHKYKKLIDQIISDRLAGTSTDSAPQYTIRQKNWQGVTWTQEGEAILTNSWVNEKGKIAKAIPGAAWIKQWPIFASALTDIPAEPRMLDEGSPYWKLAGVALPQMTSIGAQAQRDAMKRKLQARLKLDELRLNLGVNHDR